MAGPSFTPYELWAPAHVAALSRSFLICRMGCKPAKAAGVRTQVKGEDREEAPGTAWL